MIHDVNDVDFRPGCLYDADTGEELPLVYRYDDETGDYWHFVRNAQGRAQVDPSNPNELWKAHGKRRRLLFVPFDENRQAPFPADTPLIVDT